MIRKQPTKAQIKEFWERRGFICRRRSEFEPWWEGGMVCVFPDGSLHKNYPPIDFTNLFELAVPLAVRKIMLELGTDYDDALHSLIHNWMVLMRGKKDPALALFWTLQEVREKSNEQG